MIAVEIRLLTGRYHATPWGRHVNEGDVEWPPSPWRLLRALLATGFSRLGWSVVPPEARSLISTLARCAPVVALPPGMTAHTRHFMPPFKGNKDKVIDAFVDVGRDAVLGIEWDVELAEDQTRLLDDLLGRLSYLGRAEGWVEARRAERIADGLTRCAASATAPGPHHERIALLGPMSADDYAAWREQRVAAELAGELAKKRAAAEAKGKKAPTKLTAREAAKLDEMYPATLIEALLADTGALQKAGWSQPPGSEWISYWRHERLLAPPPTVRRSARAGAPPHAALLAVASDTKHGERLPRFTDALLRLELLHDALTKLSSAASADGRPSPCLIGKADGARLDGHQHATLVPLCLDGGSPTWLDHILVYAPMGLDDAAQDALRRVHPVYGRGMRFFVSLVGLGGGRDLASAVPALRSSRVWTSSTPFVPPRHLKRQGKNTLIGQVVAELESRGIPHPQRIDVEAAGGRWINLEAVPDGGVPPAPRWRHFRRARLDPDRKPASTRAFGLRLTFAESRPGPISLGYASHFGLGAFEPDP